MPAAEVAAADGPDAYVPVPSAEVAAADGLDAYIPVAAAAADCLDANVPVAAAAADGPDAYCMYLCRLQRLQLLGRGPRRRRTATALKKVA